MKTYFLLSNDVQRCAVEARAEVVVVEKTVGLTSDRGPLVMCPMGANIFRVPSTCEANRRSSARVEEPALFS